ncbi:50S ribosomal protein L25/general stress protein Ctc [Pseudoglutamicibacter cumminsii]|uniref:50S ribosomal protein L25/general stress protein Ctc n=1 Tax=Pseudoglutamicibacter cumminsii TaxID=156979 RepID=UPI002552CA7D|nr:50S ribosomal protein L25/general stress protein Ctc [Pseudoglutamicibacter cumminsii]MDK7083720.1 50S ribosomal protein L25/general stress protein Ctc [Pseudoglutamicibacter cumminsii]
MQKFETIDAEVREDFGKGSARRARRDGQIPAVVYGHGAEPEHLLLPAHQTTLAVRQANAILSLKVAGDEHLVMVKDIQRHPLRQTVDHLDLLIVKRGEKVSVNVYLDYQGEVAPGLAASLDIQEVTVLADALNIPDTLVVNLEGREEGSVLATDIELPEGVELEIDPETVIATVEEPQEIELPEDEETEGAGEEAAEAPAEEKSEEDSE